MEIENVISKSEQDGDTIESNLRWGYNRPYEQVFGNLVSSIITQRPNPWYYSPLFHVGYVEFDMQLQGSRYKDFRYANIQAGISRNGYSPFGCTWHHVYNIYFDPNTAWFHMQLVDRWLHCQTIFHVGAYRQGQESGLYSESKMLCETDVLRTNSFHSKEDNMSVDVEKSLRDIQTQYYPKYVFPASLLDFYEKYVNDNFRPKILGVNSNEDYLLAQLYPIIGDYKFKLQETVAMMQSNDNYPKNLVTTQVPFAEDGYGNIYYLDIKNGDNHDAPVYFLNHETGELIKLFDSLYNLVGTWGEVIWNC